jgi:hypothetical protein
LVQSHVALTTQAGQAILERSHHLEEHARGLIASSTDVGKQCAVRIPAVRLDDAYKP